MFGANDDARGFETDFRAMRAKVTFCGGVRFGVEINRVVRTRLQTRLTADAQVRVKFDDAVFALIHCLHGANVNARRIGAVIAARDLEKAARVGEHTFFGVLYPRAIDAERNLILGFARRRACVTTDTLAIVNQESIIHWRKKWDRARGETVTQARHRILKLYQ
jgi:hypothetical protein